MKNLKSKVILTAFVLLFALFTSFGTTYAWFTISNTVTVDSMSMTVSSGTSLLIRVYNGEYEGDAAQDAIDEASLLDATTYLNTLTATNIKASGKYAGLDNYRLSPVTAADDDTYAALNGKSLKTMNIMSKVLTETTNANSGTGDYIELKFWLFSQTASADIVLADLSITTAAETNPLDTQDNVKFAVNLAAWKSQEKAVAVTVEPAQIYSIDPDYAFAFTSGMNGAADDSGSSAPYALTLGQQSALLNDHAFFAGTADVDYVSKASDLDATVLTTLAPDTPSLITVRIYIEGWDAQMTNAVLAAKFNISFGFKVQSV